MKAHLNDRVRTTCRSGWLMLNNEDGNNLTINRPLPQAVLTY